VAAAQRRRNGQGLRDAAIHTQGDGFLRHPAQASAAAAGNGGSSRAFNSPTRTKTASGPKRSRREEQVLVLAIGGNGAGGGSGGQVTVDHTGDITTDGGDAYGIFAQSIGGGRRLRGDAHTGFDKQSSLKKYDRANLLRT